ncbi:AMP-binding protein [Rhodococcus rhodnii]|uniref:AMP-binding protein n=1 Tax=Rhodococcus rhodnii TaxID=38312 RepID=UPI00039FFB8E|nr:AMP-binding protein [Rhodococcus rhodnii]
MTAPVTRVPVPGESIRERLYEIAAAAPDRIAIVCGGERITFGRLVATATASARGLVALGTAPVALDTVCSLDCVRAVVTILISGRPLVLLDSQLPEDRRTAIVDLSGAQRLSPEAVVALSGRKPLRPLSRADTAVLLFTSGSTGTPKAVRHGQRLWLGQAVDFAHHLDVGPEDRIGSALPIGFGGGMDVVVMALLNGAALHWYDPREIGRDGIEEWVRSNDLTTLHATPSLLRSIVASWSAEAAPRTLRLVTTCGEAVHSADVASARARLGDGFAYCNLSGSSETGNLAFAMVGSGAEVPERIPAGVPGVNKVVRIDSPDASGAGEIVVESEFVAEGYVLGDGTRFEPVDERVRRYRTGDLGRFDADGRLNLLGRMDGAVKVRGYLVEPSEIEAAALRAPGVSEAVVIAQRTDAGAVVAAFVSGPGAREVAAIRRHLALALPSWMLPTHVVPMTSLPRTERGKVDRANLVVPAERPPFAAARPGVELAAAEAWRRELGVAIGRDEDPFALGGTSLGLVRVLARIEAETGRALGVHDVVADASPAGIAGAAGSAAPEALPASATRLGGDAGPVVWAFCGAGADPSCFADLARAYDGTVYALAQHGLERRGVPDWTVAAMVRRHLRTMRAVQPQGPYRLVGHSLGGILAIEVARALRAEGHDVAALTVLDTLLPPGARPVGTGTTPVSGPAIAAPPLVERVRVHARVYTAGVIRREHALQEKVFWEQGVRVGARWRPRPLDVPARVVIAADNPDDPQWWRRILTGPLDIDRVAGDHHAVLHAPTIHTVARARARLSDPLPTAFTRRPNRAARVAVHPVVRSGVCRVGPG